MPIHPTFLSDARADEGHRLAFGPAAQSGSPITDALESKAEDCLPRGTGTGWFAPITCCRRRLSPLIPSFGHAGAAGARSRAIRERISTSAETRLPRRGRGRDMGKSGTAAIHPPQPLNLAFAKSALGQTEKDQHRRSTAGQPPTAEIVYGQAGTAG
jgi:hypothetical protein